MQAAEEGVLRRMLGEEIARAGMARVVTDEWNDECLGDVTGLPTRDHWKVCSVLSFFLSLCLLLLFFASHECWQYSGVSRIRGMRRSVCEICGLTTTRPRILFLRTHPMIIS